MTQWFIFPSHKIYFNSEFHQYDIESAAYLIFNNWMKFRREIEEKTLIHFSYRPQDEECFFKAYMSAYRDSKTRNIIKFTLQFDGVTEYTSWNKKCDLMLRGPMGPERPSLESLTNSLKEACNLLLVSDIQDS